MGIYMDLNPGYIAIDYSCRPRILSCNCVLLHPNFPNSSIKTLLPSLHFLGNVDIVGDVPRSALFLWTPPSSVHSSTAWLRSTVRDLTHKAGKEFRDKGLYLELHAERDWKQVQAPKGCSRADLGDPDGRSQGHRQQMSHGRGFVFKSTLHWTEGEHRLTVFVGKAIIFWYCWHFYMFLALKTWTDEGGKRPVGLCHWIGSFPCLFRDTEEGNLADAWH